MDKEVFEYIAAVWSTVSWWLDVHGVPPAWAEHHYGDPDEFITNEELKLYIPSKLESTGDSLESMRVDVRRKVIRMWIMETCTKLCTMCGSVMQYGEDCLCVDHPDVDQDEYGEFHVDVEDAHEEDVQIAIDYLEEIDFPSRDTYRIYDVIEKWLNEEGYDMYRTAVNASHDLNEHMMNMWNSLCDMDSATDHHELLAATSVATQLYHASGKLIEQYGERFGVSGEDVDIVRNLGWEEAFDEAYKDYIDTPFSELLCDIRDELGYFGMYNPQYDNYLTA